MSYLQDEVQELKETVGGLERRVTGRMDGFDERLTSEIGGVKEMIRQLQASVTQLIGSRGNPTGSQATEPGGPNGEETSDTSGETGKETKKYRKLELPVFMGDDPLGWFFKMERYFHVHAIAEADKLDAAILCLEGKALNWYLWVETRISIRSWLDFKHEALRRFHLSQLGDEYEMLLALRQENSVMELVEEFERLSATLKGIPEECLVGTFKNALKPDIRAELRLTHATTLRDLMEMALRIEEKNQALEQTTVTRATRFPVQSGGSKPDPTQHISTRLTRLQELNTHSTPPA